MKRNIFCLIGGISRNSLNQKLFRGLKEIAGEEAHLESFSLESLPFFSQDLEMNPPEIVQTFKNSIRQAQAVLFVTPEYNRSFPGVLKNAIDWGSRPYGQNLWKSLPAGVLGASSGNVGTFGAQHHLRQVLSYLELMVMNQPEVYFNGAKSFDKTGQLIDPKSREIITQFWNSFKDWIDQVGNREHPHSNGSEDAPFITH